MTTDGLVPGCYACDQQSGSSLPPREDIVHTDHWRVAHAFGSTLPGWLILLPVTHVLSFAGCVKTYLMQFSEAEGFSHLHLHLVPRMPDHPEQACGPAVFAYLDGDESRWLPPAERDDIALALRAAFAGA